MRRLIPLALLLSSCATYHYESGDSTLGYRWNYTASAVLFGIFVVLPAFLLWYLFWLPRGYRLVISPGSSYMYLGELTSNGTQLPDSWGAYKGNFVPGIRMQAVRAARVHKKWGKL